MAESYGTGVAYATKDNIKLPTNERPEAVLITEARLDLDERLTGEFDGGRVITDAESDVSETTAQVIEIAEGTATEDKVELLSLPEDVAGTFIYTLSHSGGGPTATTAIDLDASAATVQAAVDVVTGAANEVVVGKVTGKRVFPLKWSSAGEDLTDFAVSTVAVTETGERGIDLETVPYA
jgi:hypothetical protein